MPESSAHHRARKRAAGSGGGTEVPLRGKQRLDALTKGGGRVTEVERSGSSAGLVTAARRLKKSRKISSRHDARSHGSEEAARGSPRQRRHPCDGAHHGDELTVVGDAGGQLESLGLRALADAPRAPGDVRPFCLRSARRRSIRGYSIRRRRRSWSTCRPRAARRCWRSSASCRR